MTTPAHIPGSVLDADTMPTLVVEAPEAAPEWTPGRVRDFWRRTARARMLRAFDEHGVTPDVHNATRLAFEHALCGEPPDPFQRAARTASALSYPFFSLAYDGAQEGFAQAANEAGLHRPAPHHDTTR